MQKLIVHITHFKVGKVFRSQLFFVNIRAFLSNSRGLLFPPVDQDAFQSPALNSLKKRFYANYMMEIITFLKVCCNFSA